MGKLGERIDWRHFMKLGHRQVAVLVEAASEVTVACPWVWIDGDRRQVDSLSAKGLLGSTDTAFGITPLGCLNLRHYDRALAREAIAGLRRERDAGSVMPSALMGEKR